MFSNTYIDLKIYWDQKQYRCRQAILNKEQEGKKQANSLLLFQLTRKIIFSSRTSSLDVQHAIESSIEKRTKDVFGPPLGKRLAVLIDDVNSSQTDW